VINFEDKEYFLKICAYAGYREGKKNRFRKRDLRYLITIYSKILTSKLSDTKRKKLENKIGNDSVLELSAEEFHKIIVDAGGKENIQWSNMRQSLNNLQNIIEPITDSLKHVDKRKEFRDELGEILISQLSVAMQLIVISKESDYDYGYNLAKNEEFKKKSKSNSEFVELFEKLKMLLKDFKQKDRLIEKKLYYEFEQTASMLDALKTENEFKEYFKRKTHLSSVLR